MLRATVFFISAFWASGAVAGYTERKLEAFYLYSKEYFRAMKFKADGENSSKGEPLWYYDIHDCSGSPLYIKPLTLRKGSLSDKKKIMLTTLAYETARAEALFSTRYGKQYWAMELIGDEKRVKSRIISAKNLPDLATGDYYELLLDYDRYVKLLNRDPEVINGNVAPAANYGECGAGEVEVVFSTPGKQSLHIITDFEYKFCRNQKINAEDFSLCDGWFKIRAGEAINLSGIYRYKLANSKGRAERVDVDKYIDYREASVTISLD